MSKYDGIFNKNTRKVASKLYEYLKNNRHGLFHVDGIVEMTRIIETRQEVDEVVHDVFSLIEECHVEMNRK